MSPWENLIEEMTGLPLTSNVLDHQIQLCD